MCMVTAERGNFVVSLVPEISGDIVSMIYLLLPPSNACQEIDQSHQDEHKSER